MHTYREPPAQGPRGRPSHAIRQVSQPPGHLFPPEHIPAQSHPLEKFPPASRVDRCQYCGARPRIDELSVDHVVPRSRGGQSTWTNCVLSCLRCNRKKGNRRLEEAGLRLLRPAVEPPWTPCISIPLGKRKTSWQQFISREYWEVELDG